MLAGDSASVDDTTMPPNGMDTSGVGSEPAASSKCSHWMRRLPPSAVATSAVLPSSRLAPPCTASPPFVFNRAATPPVSLPTMPSFHATVCAMSMAGACTEMPSGDLSA
ncbi:hypothetical protein G6F50_017604 [Rhizopus delemar]|uniref:Uncharacterized protein n=1 Tax=Rhizopus delemar TaxID=936053 RepID=A0A9P6XQ67_9FUNG|nr:hypothetical protein G6F50_017604 [Rhizopus delemar]